jgi:hypothetical protein
MRKRVGVLAVWDEDLEKLLESLGDRNPLRGAEASCAQCGRPIEPEDIAAIRVANGLVELICDEAACLGSVSVPAHPEEP